MTGAPVIRLTARNVLAGVGVDHAENTASFLGHLPGQHRAWQNADERLSS